MKEITKAELRTKATNIQATKIENQITYLKLGNPDATYKLFEDGKAIVFEAEGRQTRVDQKGAMKF